MFLGQHFHTLDEKGRLTIPTRFRELLNGEAIVAQGMDTNLNVMPVEVFKRIGEQINQHNINERDVRIMRRMYFSSSIQVEPDKANRILIPQFLRQAAVLDTEVVLVGVGNYFEIWSTENWSKQQALLEDDDANAQRFSKYQISTI